MFGKVFAGLWRSDHGADLAPFVPHLADRAILVRLGARHRLAMVGGEDVLLLDDRAARLRDLVDPIMLHAASRFDGECNSRGERASGDGLIHDSGDWVLGFGDW